jgi:hypothetical protein
VTVIAGIQFGGRVWLGGDSALSGDSVVSIMLRPKVFSRGAVAIGHAGSLRVGNVIETTKLPAYDDGDSYRFVVQVLMPAIAEALEGAGENMDDEELLLGLGGELYAVDSEAGVHGYHRGYGAIGDGAQAALGAIHATTRQPAEFRLRAGLLAAEALCTTVAGPFHVVSV